MVVGLILSYVVVFVIVALMLAFWLFTGVIYWNRRKYAHIPTVRPSSFYFGHRKFLADCMAREDGDSSFDSALHEMHKKTGSLVFCIHVLHFTMVVILDAKTIKDVTLDERNKKPPQFYKDFRSLFGSRFIGRGLLTEPDPEQWHKRRVILNKAFNRKFLKDFMDPFNASTDLFIDKLSEKADGKTEIIMQEHVSRCALDVISKVAFGLDLGIIENENSFFNQAFSTVLLGYITATDIISTYDFRQRKFREDVRSAIAIIRDTGKECLSKRIDEMNSCKEVPEDILYYIIKAGQEVSGDDKEKMEVMMDEFALFFFAGQETTANMLAFTIQALGRNPKVLKRLKKEVDTVLGDQLYVTYDDLNKLEYMTQVFKESLRLWPPASGISRKLAYDVDVAGYKVPAGSSCIFNSFVLARMEQYYHNALKFDPDRFKREEDTTQYTYFPFAFGPRSCIGQHFAMIEARVILSRFLQRFQFELVPGQKFHILQVATSKPKEGCKVYLTDAHAQ